MWIQISRVCVYNVMTLCGNCHSGLGITERQPSHLLRFLVRSTFPPFIVWRAGTDSSEPGAKTETVGNALQRCR
jgi:hypothetical protein